MELAANFGGLSQASAPPARRKCVKMANGSQRSMACNMKCAPRRSGVVAHVERPANMVRRVVRVAEESSERVVVEVLRFGHARNTRLEFVAASLVREARRVDRSQFGDRLRQILTDRFRMRPWIRWSPRQTCVIRSPDPIREAGAPRFGGDCRSRRVSNEESATLDGILTFGLIWLQHARMREAPPVSGLRLFLPRGKSAVTAHRLTALASPQEVSCMNTIRCTGVCGESLCRTPESGHLDCAGAAKSSRPSPPRCRTRSEFAGSLRTPFTSA